MKYFLFPLFFTVFGCSCSNYYEKKRQNAKMDTMLHTLTKFNDSLFTSVPDSFKKWIRIWDTVLVNDVRYRSNGHDYFHENVAEQDKLDAVNIAIVTDFLDKYGFPAPYVSGPNDVMVIVSVMQHASTKTQEKYYPMWVEAYKDNKIPGFALAMLEDRINMHRYRKQYYGTQQSRYEGEKDFMLYPVVNPDSINAWRKQMIANDTIDCTIEKEYKDFYKKEWDVEKYKKELPDLIKKFKVNDSTPIRFVKQP